MAEACEATPFIPRQHYDYDGVENMSTAESNCVFKHGSGAAVSAQPTTLKSDISTEISSGCIEMDARNRCCLNADRTESWCSEPVSFPNPGLEEASSESASSAQIAPTSSSHDTQKVISLDVLSISSSKPDNKLDKINGDGKAGQDEDAFVTGFDLNKDTNENGMDDCVPSQHAIQVVAKAGQLSGQPKVPLQFQGMLGWKGIAETSAFHPIALAKSSARTACSEAKNEPGLIGIDLNAAAASEEDEPPPSSEVGSKQSQGQPWIDLNCLCDDTDQLIHPSTEKLPSVDLNMNRIASAAANTSYIAADFLSPRKQYSNLMGHDYLTGFGSVQHVASNPDMPVAAANILQPMELMQRVTPLQLSSRGPYNLCSRGPFPAAVPFPGSIRYAPYPHDHAIYPALLNPGTIHPAFYAPHLVQIVHEPNSGNTAPSIPRIFIPDGNIPAFGIQTNRAQQVPEYFTSMKRKEPEGGFRGYQLGTNRQL